MRYELYFKRNKYFKYFCFGIDRIFAIKLYKKGFIFTICYFDSLLKKYEIEIGWFPFYYNKIIY
jgi:hypothetical protein